jgi:hypothetical protein
MACLTLPTTTFSHVAGDSVGSSSGCPITGG